MFPECSAFPRRLSSFTSDFHPFLGGLQLSSFQMDGSNRNENNSPVYQRSFQCINNDVTVAIINIVHVLCSAVEDVNNVDCVY